MKKIAFLGILLVVVCIGLLQVLGSRKALSSKEEPLLRDQDDQTDTYAIPLDSSEAEEEDDLKKLEQQLKKPLEKLEKEVKKPWQSK